MSDGTGIASARPDRLVRFAGHVERLGRTLGDTAQLTHQAAVAYLDASPDGTPTGAPGVATEAAEATRAIGVGTRRIGLAFRDADRGADDRAVASSSDLALTRLIAARYPDLLDHVLLAPIRRRAAEGRAVGREVADLLAAGRTDDAFGALLALDDATASDPTFAAALVNELEVTDLLILADALTVVPSRGRPPAGADGQRLVTLLREAARGWDHPAAGDPLAPLGPALDPGLVEALGAEPEGRNLLRLVVLQSAGHLGHGLLGRIARLTLIDHAPDLDLSASASSSLLDGAAPASGLLDALRLHPEVAVELLLGPGAGITATTRALVEHASGGADQDALARLLRTVLAEPAFAPEGHRSDRALLVGALVTTIGADPGAIRAPMAALLVETVELDLGAWALTAERSPGSAPPDPSGRSLADGALQGVASHPDEFVALIAALDAHERRLLVEAVAGVAPAAEGATVDLAGLDDVLAALRRGSATADVPEDPWAWVFAAGRLGVGAAAGRLPGGPLVQLTAKPLTNAALAWGREASKGDAGTTARDVRDHQLARRRNAWLAIAMDPARADQIRWDVPGSSIRSADDLALLGTELDAALRLESWSGAQDGALRALVHRLEGGGD